jgi:hypothetical protein
MASRPDPGEQRGQIALRTMHGAPSLKSSNRYGNEPFQITASSFFYNLGVIYLAFL